MDKYFKHMREDKHLIQGAELLIKETFTARGLKLPTFTDKLELRRFISESYRLHTKQCGTGTCLHLSKFFQALSGLLEKINSRKAMKINMQNIYKI